MDVDADRLVVAFQGEVDAFDFEHLAGGEALVHFAVDGVDDGVHLGVMLCRAHVFDHCFQHRLADVGTDRHRGGHLVLGPRERFVSGVEDAFHAETEGEEVEVDVIALQPHLDAFFCHQEEVFEQLFLALRRDSAVDDQLRQVVQCIGHTSDYTERVIVFVGCQVIRVRVAPELTRLYFFSHDSFV